MDLALNNRERLICHKTQANQPTNYLYLFSIYFSISKCKILNFHPLSLKNIFPEVYVNLSFSLSLSLSLSLDHLMPKPSLLKNNRGTIQGFHTFPNDISPKVNVIVRLEFEIVYYIITVQHVSHCTIVPSYMV